MPSLNIMCPKFHSAPLHSSLKNDLKPYMIFPLRPDLDMAIVTVEKSWYNHSFVAALLFKHWDMQQVQLPIGKQMTIENIELHLLCCLEHKTSTPIPLIVEVPTLFPLNPKKKRMLPKLLHAALPPPPLIIASFIFSPSSGPPIPLPLHLAAVE